jgi:hypothetical protein
VTSIRTNSTFGDLVRDQFDWFEYVLLKTGDQGHHFADIWNTWTYDDCLDNIQKSGKFQLVGELRRPDGSTLELYKRILKTTPLHQ